MYEQLKQHIANGRLTQALKEASELAASLKANDFGNELLEHSLPDLFLVHFPPLSMPQNAAINRVSHVRTRERN